MTFEVQTLEKWDSQIRELVGRYRLNCYPQEFEICDHNEMLGYMAYSGMPSRYSHWSFGKGYERQKTLYDHGVSGLPYEMVINSNPCLAYLMRDNSLLLQILTIAHVYGHNDFFANNFTFKSATNAAYSLEFFKNHSTRIDKYIEDPSIGIDAIENLLDHAHSLQLQCRKNYAIKKLSPAEQEERLLKKMQSPEDPHREIHPKATKSLPNITRFPIEADEDILHFVATHNPYLSEWQRDVLRIVADEGQYFVPQIETKIMNEGWASYWHYKIINALNLSSDLHLEFIVRHNQVLRPSPGGINPYHLGFILWHEIEKNTNIKAGIKYDKDGNLPPDISPEETPGRKMIFQIRESDRDSSFLRRFLNQKLIEELELFQHERRGKDRVITKVASEESWEEIKENLIRNVGANSIPVIKIEDADFGRERTLYLKHYHDGRDLLLEYCEQTLRHIKALWERDVVLESELNGKKSLLRLIDGALKVEKI
jgi:stage V sporulation protein R